ncbi:MAG: ribose ABC transporter permease [Spirochaetaceae bacterium]|nr:ribose ABC transporter permease [Spirochaetaceae bacterium]
MNKPLRHLKKQVSINGALGGLVILCVIFTILTEHFMSVYNLINIARQCSINLILATGMTFIVLTGGIDLSVGGVMALVGTLIAGFMREGMTVGIAVSIGLLIGTLTGLVSGLLVTYGKIPAFIATMAMLTISRSLALMYSGGYPITGIPKIYSFIGTGSVGPVPVPVLIAVLVVLFGLFVLKKSIFGRYIYAIGGNENAAVLSGINVNMWKIITYVVHGILTAVAGIVLTARMNSGQPGAASGIELDIIAAVVIGGTSLTGGEGGIFGTLMGALVITVLNNGLVLLNVNPYLQGLIVGCVILIAVFLDKRKKNK